MKRSIFEVGIPYYQANVWIKYGAGDPLLLEEFTTKKEAVACIKRFRKQYNGSEELECYVKRFDENECCEYSFDV